MVNNEILVKRSVLDWEKRHKIIRGIARGILYLHEDSQVRIIHRDLKPSNVLLDGAMDPKIADFGMARLFGQDDTQGNTSKIAGTYGYMAPEYAMHGQFSIKSDVFSFGVLVLEAWKNWKGRTPAELVDPILCTGLGSTSDLVRCIHIALLCVQENAIDRPTMASVVLMLNSVSLTMATPTEPAFYIPPGYMAPEYAMHGQFSTKSDVFSFGVLVLEIISGQKCNSFRRGEIVQNLLTFAWKNWKGRTPAELVDPILRSGLGSITDMVRCIHIALLCVQENATDRPTMASVVLMLNSVSFTMATPTAPAFYMPSDYGSNSSNSNLQTQSDTSSRNEASISDLYPR
ncbi:hypothetical protein CASFOL_028942 [Castilleja foliolosa]|uniref:Protein kinase domain-containing protein n=1 Tax=Castilleja foliolosa TaxID=1961234 RepID=A0ABD3CE48_9LAMI